MRMKVCLLKLLDKKSKFKSWSKVYRFIETIFNWLRVRWISIKLCLILRFLMWKKGVSVIFYKMIKKNWIQMSKICFINWGLIMSKWQKSLGDLRKLIESFVIKYFKLRVRRKSRKVLLQVCNKQCKKCWRCRVPYL